jgi:hypothetical protein
VREGAVRDSERAIAMSIFVLVFVLWLRYETDSSIPPLGRRKLKTALHSADAIRDFVFSRALSLPASHAMLKKRLSRGEDVYGRESRYELFNKLDA